MVAQLQSSVLPCERQVTDLHRHFIDHLTIPDAAGTGVLRRVDEVFDCWFESGAMPYAQVHYPFEHKEAFEAQFPADFVAEGGLPVWYTIPSLFSRCGSFVCT